MPGIEDCKCILLIGGTSGIGQALAYALLDLSSKPTVIVGGRRKERLAEMKRERLETLQVDINADAPKLKAFVDETIQQYPDARIHPSLSLNSSLIMIRLMRLSYVPGSSAASTSRRPKKSTRKVQEMIASHVNYAEVVSSHF